MRWTQSDASPLGSKATRSARPSPSTSATSEWIGLAAQSVSQYWPRLRAYPSLAQAEAAASHAVTIPENPPRPSRNALRPIIVGPPGWRPVSNVATDEYEVKVGELTLRSGADIDAKATFYGLLIVTPLDMLAHTGGNLCSCRFLIANGAKISSCAFLEALAHRGRSFEKGVALAEPFLEMGFENDLNSWKGDGTALHPAANVGVTTTVKWLLEHGAVVNGAVGWAERRSIWRRKGTRRPRQWSFLPKGSPT